MPTIVTDTKLINLIDVVAAEMEAINKANEGLEKRRLAIEESPELKAINDEQEALNTRAKELQNNAKELNQNLNEVYGYGNWHNLNIKNYTFITREELEQDPDFVKKHYIMANPAIKERVETDDIQLTERKVMNDPELCQELDKIIEEQDATKEIIQQTD